jgi:CubicO group peptidase (beta-lactamase class C family)
MLIIKKFLPFFIFSLSALAETSLLDSELEKIKAAYLLPGISAAIYIDGNLVEHSVAGIRKVGSEKLISKTDKFHLGSCTKSMTATIAATFVEEGKLTWKSTLRELLPTFQIHPELQNVTYEMLLAHRAGVERDPSDELHIELEKLDSQQGRNELTKIFLNQAPTFNRNEFNYSNIGYIIAGNILEVLSGKSWEMLMHERLFIPLKMATCGFGPTSILGEEAPSQPWGHIVRDYTVKAVHDDNAPFYGPAANVHCSTQDWVKFLSMHVDGFNHSSKFLKQENFDQLHRLALVSKSEEYTFGGWYKLQRDWARGDVLTHTGSNTYNFAAVWIAPRTNTILVSTTNRSHYSGSWATSDAISAMIRLFIKN